MADQIDLLNKDILTAALKFTMLAGGSDLATVIYRDGEFWVEISFQNNDAKAIITHEVTKDGAIKKNIDHSFSDIVNQFLKEKIIALRIQQSRLHNLSFNQ